MKMFYMFCLFLMAACTPANVLAQEEDYTGAYARLGIGASINDNERRIYEGTPRTSASMEIAGLNIDGSLGYDFGPVRLETEVQYSRLKPIGQGCLTCRTNQQGEFVFLPDDSPISGSSQSMTGAVNILYDFDPINFLTFSVGGGIGISDLRLKTTSDGFVKSQSGKATNLMWQGIVEATFQITDTTAVTARYSYQDMGKMTVVNQNLSSTHNRYNYQNYSLGLTQRF